MANNIQYKGYLIKNKLKKEEGNIYEKIYDKKSYGSYVSS